MDLLAIAAADPTVIPLWAAFLFAVGMYPVGMFFGCSSCCGPVCKSCCRDEVSQIVVDFNLEATGEQFISELPITGEWNLGDTVTVDGKGGQPQFILEGQQSGARVLARAVANYTDDPGNGFISIPSPFGPGVWSRPSLTISPVVALPMGAAFRAEFVNGESVTVTPVGFTPDVVEQPSLTAVVGECPVVYAVEPIPGRGLPPVSFSGNPGKWKNPQRGEDAGNDYRGDGMPPVSSLTVDCQGDEGTVVFDVEDHDGRPPGTCDWCNPVIERSMAHPANRPLDPCDTWAGRYSGFGFAATAEVSDLSVSVPLMAFGESAADCGSEVVASATMKWSGLAGGGESTRTETYTLNREEQDCIPFSAWSKTSAPPCEQSVRSHVTLSAVSPAGEGFYGIATKPDSTPGPITETKIVNGGSGYLIPGRVAPTVTVSASGGSGADLQVSLESFTDYYDGLTYWRISSVIVGPGGGGSGYSAEYWGGITLTTAVQSPGIETSAAYLIADIDENGAITAPFVYDGGAYHDEDGIVAAPVTISVSQDTCYSNGAGAVITPTVDVDPESDTYGQITALTISDGGHDYLARTVGSSPCQPGGLYYGPFGACGSQRYKRCPGHYFAIGDFQWHRGCPDYTYDISIQAVEQ